MKTYQGLLSLRILRPEIPSWVKIGQKRGNFEPKKGPMGGRLTWFVFSLGWKTETYLAPGLLWGYAHNHLGNQCLSSAGTGKNCALPMKVPNPSPGLDKDCTPMGPEMLSNTGSGVWRKAFEAFPNSTSVLDKFQSAIIVWNNLFGALNKRAFQWKRGRQFSEWWVW